MSISKIKSFFDRYGLDVSELPQKDGADPILMIDRNAVSLLKLIISNAVDEDVEVVRFNSGDNNETLLKLKGDFDE